MKRYLTLALAAALLLTGCDNLMRDELSWLHNQLDDLNSRLDQLCQETNDNISALRTIVAAVEDNDYVEDVKPVSDNGVLVGYEITFSKNGKVTVYNGRDGRDGADGKDGEDGKDGADGKDGSDGKDGQNGKDGADGADGKDGADGVVPVIGVRQDTDGLWYWVVNGEWLRDQFGNKVRASANDGQDGYQGSDGAPGKNGVTPLLKIVDGYWYISYDNGQTWSQLGKATGNDGAPGKDASAPDSIFSDIQVNEHSIVFTLKDGQVITLDRRVEFRMVFEETQGITCTPGVTVRIAYTISGADSSTQIHCIADQGWTAEIEPQDSKSGNLAVTAPDPMTDAKVLVFACAGDGRSLMTALHFVQGKPVVDLEQNRYYVQWQGGDITISVRTREDITVKIPVGTKWITDVTSESGTKAAERVEDIVLRVAENKYMKDRSGAIKLLNSVGEVMAEVEILQYGNTTNSGFISFADPKVESICLTNFDTNKDGGLSFEEAAAVTDIGTKFWGCNILTFDELQYFTGLETISNDAFVGNYLISITLPENLTSIGSYAFQNASFSKIEIPDYVTSLGDCCFEKCYQLQSVRLPESLVSLGTGCFRECTKLSSIVIPDNVSSLRNNEIFYNCKKLKEVTLGSGLLLIRAWDVFYKCTLLETVIVRAIEPPVAYWYDSTSHPDYQKQNLFYWVDKSKFKIYVPAESVEKYKSSSYWSSIPDNIYSISEYQKTE